LCEEPADSERFRPGLLFDPSNDGLERLETRVSVAGGLFGGPILTDVVDP
jgi:hypothetical protein